MFQSSPTAEGGRDFAGVVGLSLVSRSFQSSPTAEGGRDTSTSRFPPRLSSFQSSPTAEGGRDPPPRARVRAGFWSFNPRPPLRVGATSSWCSRLPPTTRFNPRPPLRVGATRRAIERAHKTIEFQSSPTAEGGRDLRRRDFPRGSARFNPLAHR